MNRTWSITLLLAAAFTLGCDQCAAPSAKPAATLPASLFLAAAPASPRAVADARASAKPGDTVTLSGRVGGSLEPFAPDSATMLLVSDGPLACDALPHSKCATPWDYCCENKDTLAEQTALIRVVDAAGTPLAITLKSAKLREFARVTITGTIAESPSTPTPVALIINATGIYIDPK